MSMPQRKSAQPCQGSGLYRGGARAVIERLAVTDPGEVLWQANLSAAHYNIGEVLAKQGNFPAALAAYQASLSISERLAKADPGNAGWQSALTIARQGRGSVF